MPGSVTIGRPVHGQIAGAVSVVAMVIAAIVAGINAFKKPTKPKSVTSEAPVTKASATETAAMRTAAMKTVAMLLGTCSHTEFTVAQE